VVVVQVVGLAEGEVEVQAVGIKLGIRVGEGMRSRRVQME
jgi:hypothetical protein